MSPVTDNASQRRPTEVHNILSAHIQHLVKHIIKKYSLCTHTVIEIDICHRSHFGRKLVNTGVNNNTNKDLLHLGQIAVKLLLLCTLAQGAGITLASTVILCQHVCPEKGLT